MTEEKRRGRPRLSQEEETVVVSITVTESQAAILKHLGDGNVSAAVRKLISSALPNEEREV